MANPNTGDMTDREVRLKSLELASSAASHAVVSSGYGTTATKGFPEAEEVVKRAEVYAEFLMRKEVDVNGNQV